MKVTEEERATARTLDDTPDLHDRTDGSLTLNWQAMLDIFSEIVVFGFSNDINTCRVASADQRFFYTVKENRCKNVNVLVAWRVIFTM